MKLIKVKDEHLPSEKYAPCVKPKQVSEDPAVLDPGAGRSSGSGLYTSGAEIPTEFQTCRSSIRTKGPAQIHLQELNLCRASSCGGGVYTTESV